MKRFALLMFIISACNPVVKVDGLPKKPFIIIDKNHHWCAGCPDDFWLYEYMDANGKFRSFHDSGERYFIGDTIH